MTPKYKHSDEEFIKAVSQAETIADIRKILGVKTRHADLKKRIERLNLDTSHLSKWRKGLPSKRYKSTLDELLVKGEYRDSQNLKNRLLKENLLIYKCYICKLYEWNNQSIILQLDHIDGNKKNNTLINLRLLCPNCHSQTNTFCGRNIKNIRNNSLIHSIHSEEQVLEIYNRVHQGEKLKDLAEEFNVSQANISQIKNKKAWKYLLKDL